MFNHKLIVAADTNEGRPLGAELAVLKLCRALEGLPVSIKVSAALRACGYKLIEKIHQHELSVFADLRLTGRAEVLRGDGKLLAYYQPELVSVQCAAGVAAAAALKEELEFAKVVGVTIPATFSEKRTRLVFGNSAHSTIVRLALIAQEAKLDGIICGHKSLGFLQPIHAGKLDFYTSDVRPAWSCVKDSEETPCVTPREALESGATGLIVGSAVTEAESPREVVIRILRELNWA